MLVLIAHGSRNEAWRRSLEELITTIQDGTPGREVRLAYMQFSGPTLPEVVEEGRKGGTEVFRILPLFMASAGHVDKDIRPMVETLEERFPDARFQLLTPVGEHPLFHDLIRTIADDALSQGKS